MNDIQPCNLGVLCIAVAKPDAAHFAAADTNTEK